MSRVGKRIISLAEGVSVTVNGNVVTVKGPKGELVKKIDNKIKVKVNGAEVTTERANEDRQTKMIHGTTNSLIQGMVTGVKEGFVKELEILGVGYNVKMTGKSL